ncbi:MAG: hypothetical protein A2096_11260 [Spirochaetes bacterium GWF1_41_5]|nr:MAG: hypothetical protein A2096_11260 [Spirochaetes bacterium GWF1_41_5]
MKKKLVVLMLCLSALNLLLISCTGKKTENHAGHEQKSVKTESGIEYFTCSMHPSVKSDKPGKCPICGMELIPVFRGDGDKIIVDEKTRETIGIKSIKAAYMNLSKKIRLPGRVANDNDLYIAQQEYLTSYKNLEKIRNNYSKGEELERFEKILQSSALRLKLLGFDEREITKLQNADSPDMNLIYPDKKAYVIAEIYENDLYLVKIGQKVMGTTPAFPSDIFNGIIRAIELALNQETRSAKARIEFDNTGNKLRLEMFITLEINIDMGKHLAVPKNALIDTGIRKVVYIDLGNGRYKMTEVKTGFAASDHIQILSGINEGDKIVTEGNFLLDSQSTMTGGSSLLYGSSEEIKKDENKPLHKH